MTFDPAAALELARELSFPRAIGSPGEARAAAIIEERLRAAGLTPERQDFSIPFAAGTLMRAFLL